MRFLCTFDRERAVQALRRSLPKAVDAVNNGVVDEPGEIMAIVTKTMEDKMSIDKGAEIPRPTPFFPPARGRLSLMLTCLYLYNVIKLVKIAAQPSSMLKSRPKEWSVYRWRIRDLYTDEEASTGIYRVSAM